jgi:hypothetical protein
MKKLLFIPLILLTLSSCKKRKEIIYPESMTYGQNILHDNSISANTSYSFGAELGKSADLKIVLTNLSVQPNPNQAKPVWFYSNHQGWTVSEYGTDDTQTFTSNKDGEIILNMIFSGSPGSCKIDFYENSSSITKKTVQYLSW